MTLEEYKNQVKLLQEEHERKRFRLAFEYAISNNNVQVGDFVTDHVGTIKVDKISMFYDKEIPSLIYYGQEYTKTGKQLKNGSERPVYQINVESK